MNQPGLVSVVVPVYNGARYLREAIDSALGQTYSPIEVVVVDDGSTDKSPRLLSEYADRIILLRQPNRGVAVARNTGIARCTGEFIAFLDQDDLWQPTKIEKQIQAFQSNSDIGLIHTQTAFFDEKIAAFVSPQLISQPSRMVGACFDRLLLGNPIVNSSVVIRLSVLHQVGGCDLRIRGNTCQDYDLWLRAAQYCEFGFVDEPLTVFRVHQAQGQTKWDAMLHEELRVLLRRFPIQHWRKTLHGRARIGNLYDELATVHFNAGDARRARHYFSKAMALNPSRRQALRLAVSCLPHHVAKLSRDMAHLFLHGAPAGRRNST